MTSPAEALTIQLANLLPPPESRRPAIITAPPNMRGVTIRA
ncbi:MAG TPA: hypothetical protein VF970_05260 [Gemmatimonadales bacterium]